MADRMDYKAPNVYQQTMSAPATDDGTGDFFRTAANVFLTNANELQQTQLRNDLAQAKTDGEKIGYDAGANFKPMQGSSLLSRQFNDSGIFAAAQKVNLASTDKVTQLSQQFKANPEGLKKALGAYGDNFVKGLPTEMQTPFRQQFDTLGRSAVISANSQMIELRKQNAAASWYDYDIKTQNAAENFAQNMFVAGPEGDQARMALSSIRANRISALSAQGPLGSGAFTPLEIEKQKREFDVNLIHNGVVADFQKQVDNGRGPEAYMSFVKGDTAMFAVDGKGDDHGMMKVKDFLTNDEMEKVAGDMATHIGRVNSMRESADKVTEKFVDQYNDGYLKNAYSKAYSTTKDEKGNTIVTGGDPIAVQSLAAAAQKDPMVKPETYNKIMDLAQKIGTGETDNPVVVGNAWKDITENGMTDTRSIPAKGIGDETRIKMMNAIQDRQKSQHWSNSIRYNDVKEYARNTLAPEASTGMAMFGNPSSTSAADLAEWNKRMVSTMVAASDAGILPKNLNAAPIPGSGEIDIYQTGKDLAEVIKASHNKPAEAPPAVKALDDQILEVKNSMNNPKPGDDTKAIADRYRQLQEKRSSLMATGPGAGGNPNANITQGM